MRLPSVAVPLSGERFRVTYSLTAANEAEARQRAVEISFEQTVEFPADLTPEGDILEKIVGHIEEVTQKENAAGWRVVISYTIESAGDETTQFMNVVFGNTSIQKGVRVESFELPPAMAAKRGPRFGRSGLRELLHAPSRPMLCTALKPMGYGAKELARLAGDFARGGIDLIKDDHGLANQSFSTFKERAKACAEAVHEANAITGYHSLYMPHISAPAEQVLERALLAKELGAGALLVCPGLIGWDTMRMLADDDRLNLPIMSHPALIGSFTASADAGISHYTLYGLMPRLFGADASIFPSWGGRFSFSKEECASIVAGSGAPFAEMKSIFPTPGGGMTMDRVAEMQAVYGRDVIFLMGGGLHRHSPDIVANSARFREIVEAMK
jgi:ribulose-bisphosphate carboxylase large chain